MSYECVLKCGKPCESSDKINQGKWGRLQSKAKNWSGLDKFGHVYTTTSWQDGPGNHYIHQSCYISISSSDKLEKARRRTNQESDIAQCSSSEMPAQKALCDKESEGPSPKRLRSVSGPLHDKTKCVCGACKVRTQDTQIECEASCSESTHSQHGTPSSATQSL